MIQPAKDALHAWANDFDERHLGVRDPDQLRRIHKDEQRAPDQGLGGLRRAMAALDFALFVTALVHYSSNDIAKEKVQTVQRVTGEPMSRRDYWNKLGLVHYYIAGRVFERETHAAA